MGQGFRRGGGGAGKNKEEVIARLAVARNCKGKKKVPEGVRVGDRHAEEAAVDPSPENSWRNSAVMGSDAHAQEPTEDTRTMVAGAELAHMVAGHMLMERVEKEVEEELAPVPELEHKKLRDGTSTILPEEAILDQDEELSHAGLGWLPITWPEAAMLLPSDEPWRMDGRESHEERRDKLQIWARVCGEMFQELRKEWRRRRTWALVQ